MCCWLLHLHLRCGLNACPLLQWRARCMPSPASPCPPARWRRQQRSTSNPTLCTAWSCWTRRALSRCPAQAFGRCGWRAAALARALLPCTRRHECQTAACPSPCHALPLLSACGLATNCPAAPSFSSFLPMQAPGTFHVRTTILPPEADMAVVSQKFAEFHAGFMQRYGKTNGST